MDVDIPQLGDLVQHCNRRTGYEYIEHAYHPDGCDECARISVQVQRLLAREHDRLMNERARLILDGVDPDELLMPIPPNAGSAS